MRSHVTKQLRRLFQSLLSAVQQQARKAYSLFRQSPNHPSLRFKRVGIRKPVYSAHMNDDYRVLGILADDETIIWFWIGSHDEYERLIRSM